MMIPLRTLLAFFILALSFGAAYSASPNIPTAVSARVIGDDGAARLFIDFSAPLSAKTFYANDPQRIIIDLDEVNFSPKALSGLKAVGLFKGVSAGRINDGKSRVVIELNTPAKIMRGSLKQLIDNDLHRYQIDIEPIDAQEFASLAETQNFELQSRETDPEPDTAPKIEAQPKPNSSGKFTVVIDPGHGGIDGGAVGRLGTREKEVVLAFSLVLAKILENSPNYEVKLTRTGDEFISLRRRLAFNRNAKADLFISVHADSLAQRSVRGSTIYTLSKKASDQLSADLAEAENRVDLLAGLSLKSESDVVADILVDLTTRETKHYSKQFSRILVANLGKEVKLIKNPIRSAAFGVLKAPDVPSILLELGYLSNQEDEKLMGSPAWQMKAANAVAQSIGQFFEPRLQ